MSSTLHWTPIRAGTALPDSLKYILKERFILGSQNYVLDRSYIPYLEELQDTGIKGAKVLIKAIQDNGSIEIYLEY